MPTIEEVTSYLTDFSYCEDNQLTIDMIETISPATLIEKKTIDGIKIPLFINEYWTSRQRQTASIHEISYRACFKPQLPRFFIELLTDPGDTVYDPFAGRGTTIIEAALLERKVIANDVNPLSRILCQPRLNPPSILEVRNRLSEVPFDNKASSDLDLSMFYHPDTEKELLSLQAYLDRKKTHYIEDDLDRWIRMVATNRLSGHSKGFFSVYTMPPNQAVSAKRQKIINLKRNQKPDYRNVKDLILRKSDQLMRKMTAQQIRSLNKVSDIAMFLEVDASETQMITDQSVNLTVTSPPFLNVVQYAADNWLRCWFNQIETDVVGKKITMATTLQDWSAAMSRVFKELYRITKPGGWIAFEVGEVRGGKINLEEAVVPLGLECGFQCLGVVINRQSFTKTSNIWGVKNNQAGTNSNRIVLFSRPRPDHAV